MLADYLPGLQDAGVLWGLAAMVVLLPSAGRLVAGGLAPEAALVAGWGGYCLFMAAWAVASPAPLTLAFGLFALAALAGLFRRAPVSIPWRAIVLSVPLWLVLLPALPSQVDTWLNLLPNLAYLTDHASLPADGGPPSWSFLPAAPYNTQFVGFGMSVLAGHLAANALSLFNALLLCAAGLHLARVCGGPAARADTSASSDRQLLAGTRPQPAGSATTSFSTVQPELPGARGQTAGSAAAPLSMDRQILAGARGQAAGSAAASLSMDRQFLAGAREAAAGSAAASLSKDRQIRAAARGQAAGSADTSSLIDQQDWARAGARKPGAGAWSPARDEAEPRRDDTETTAAAAAVEAAQRAAAVDDAPSRVAGALGQPAWWACALGFLLAVPLNPGFTPRVFFASYGEAPLAVTLMFAVALGADLFAAARARAPCRTSLAALALVLAALVEIKQSALGLLVPFAAGLLLLGLAAPGMARRRWAAMVAASCAPALLLYFAWRWYVLGHFAVGELKMLPFAEWHLDLLPQILGGIAFAIFQKATYFALVAALLGAAAVEARRRPWGRAAVVLALGAALVAGFNAFLLFTYAAHFPAVWAVNAHSYFRYMSQLSLVVVLGLATWLQPAAAAWFARRTPRQRRHAARGAVALAAILPLATAPLLRFDLDAPQPTLWGMASSTAALLHDGDRLALVLPGDADDATGSLLRGVLLFTPPRLPHLDFRSELAANQAALDDAHAHGFDRALVTCAPGGFGGLAAGQAGLIAYNEGAWRPLAAWTLPARLKRERFSAMLPRSVFCK